MLASTGALRLGGNGIWGEWFAGLIDDVRVYNRALTAAEIQTDMNTPVGPPPPTDTQPPTAPGGLAATGGAELGHAQLDGRDRQRRRRALRRAPRHDRRLHADLGEPDRAAHRDGYTDTGLAPAPTTTA